MTTPNRSPQPETPARPERPRPDKADADRPLTSFCIVNTNGRALLLNCLESIFAYPPQHEFEVLVLDNASDDGSVAAVRDASGDRVQLVELQLRRGKAENDSELLARAQGDCCILLNEDSELTAGAADALQVALMGDPHAAAAGAQLLTPDGTVQPSAWRFPGVLTALMGALLLHRRLTVQSKGKGPRHVDWVQSAGMAVRRHAFEQVGPLDPAFFVYSDEVDWQRRAHEAGWSILYVPGARIIHREQLSRGAAGRRRIVEFARNRDRYMRKHHGMAAALAVRALTCWTYSLRALAALVLPGHSARRYLAHAYHSLFPSRGEGLRETADSFNQTETTTHTGGGRP